MGKLKLLELGKIKCFCLKTATRVYASYLFYIVSLYCLTSLHTWGFSTLVDDPLVDLRLRTLFSLFCILSVSCFPKLCKGGGELLGVLTGKYLNYRTDKFEMLFYAFWLEPKILSNMVDFDI